MAEGTGEGSALCVVSQAGFLNPCFNLQGLCDIAWGLESAHPVAALKTKTRQASLPLLARGLWSSFTYVGSSSTWSKNRQTGFPESERDLSRPKE